MLGHVHKINNLINILPQVHIGSKASTHAWYKTRQHLSVFVILCKALSGHCRAGSTILICNGSRGQGGHVHPTSPNLAEQGGRRGALAGAEAATSIY